ncbi:tetratricopeptide repeat protein [Bifidobacterium leontopitheci]|uniref:ADP-ribosylglycohydrolase n=1 Tax=Bifidobacterium leontopitheci TaxID=2650774 RepID=A0A6I1GG76_9BIFI|nr:tetratricopeptide repeat protein [Bifidobacterium leontopitheci]KAB7790653.1 ADP-ribosylglycohydrolase [Bifidobacterium leontopitheci]
MNGYDDSDYAGESYDEAYDQEIHGDMSLDFGAQAYTDAMNTKDPGERNRLFQQAAHWYEKSAGFGNAQAATNLGYVYLYGRIGMVDDSKAFSWFTRGAELGNEESCYKLGDLYRAGRGCARDYDAAFRLYCKAERIAAQTCDPYEPQNQAVLASIDLRLAGHWEHVAGDDARRTAHRYYASAVERFADAVDGGLHWYAKTLDSAKAGADRTAEAR